MSKKVLILSTSPRKGGNSDTLCDEFLRGAQESGHQAEKILIKDQTIHYCNGCSYCSASGKCIQKDNMEEILDKMVQADVIVMATPVYFYTMDAQMKTLIDRTVPRYTEIRNKDFYFIVTAADNSKAMLERTIEGLRGFTEDCLTGAKEKGILYATGVWKVGEVQSSTFMQQAYEMGKQV